MSFSRKNFIRSLLFFIFSHRAIFSKEILSPIPRKPKASSGKVIIIGAGIAGLGAAKELQYGGFEVTVLEGRTRIGGRIHTYHDWGYPMDLGASWIHGVKNNPITRLAKEANLDLYETDYESLEFWDQKKEYSYFAKIRSAKEFESFMTELEILSESLKKDISLGDLYKKLEKNLSIDRKPLVDWLFLTNESNLAESLDKVSAISFFREAEQLDGDDVVFGQGYEGITNYLANGVDIQLNQMVTSIQNTGKEVVVKSSQGIFKADHCIVTIPLGVLKKGSIRFSPELSNSKKSALARLDMGLLNKLYAEYEEPFWDITKVSLGIRPEKQDFRFFLNYHPFFKKATLVGFLPGDFGREAENLSDSALKDMLTKRLRTDIGKAIPNPKRVFLTRWNSDPFSFGSYSYFPVGSTGKDMLSLGEPEGRIHFAGEHTTPHYYGYVHGGYISGLRSAQEIANFK